MSKKFRVKRYLHGRITTPIPRQRNRATPHSRSDLAHRRALTDAHRGRDTRRSEGARR